ncbi:MAG: hypothetical protein HZB62_15645 [Nitrospirae bacterium]|nr:hypothetical protein [Nitrospirota bacterium]
MENLSGLEIGLSFILTWVVGLLTPLIIRFVLLRRPLGKKMAFAVSFVLYVINLAIFIALGSQSKTHAVLFVIAWIAYAILIKQKKETAQKSRVSSRNEYDEWKAKKVSAEQTGLNPPVEAEKQETENINITSLDGRLTGWKRLWILSSAIWLIILFANAFSEREFPMPEFTPHKDEFYKKMSQESRSLIAGKFNTNAQETFKVKLTTGHVFSININPNDPRNEALIVHMIKEYWSIVEAYTWELRAIYIVKFILTWALPCLFVYVLGMGFRWVYAGFK